MRLTNGDGVKLLDESLCAVAALAFVVMNISDYFHSLTFLERRFELLGPIAKHHHLVPDCVIALVNGQWKAPNQLILGGRAEDRLSANTSFQRHPALLLRRTCRG